jgi:hypothetical protein
VALLLAIASTVISTVALANKGDRTAAALPTTTGQPKSTVVSPATTPSVPPGTSPGSNPTVIQPSGAFTIAYQRQHLRIESNGCSYGNGPGIDFDEPRANSSDSTKDAEYAGCGPGSIVSQLPQAAVSGPGASPNDCLEQIRTQPGNSSAAASTGITLCLVTNANTAASQGITRKVVFLTVDSTSVAGSRGVLNFTLTAWNMPT